MQRNSIMHDLVFTNTTKSFHKKQNFHPPPPSAPSVIRSHSTYTKVISLYCRSVLEMSTPAVASMSGAEKFFSAVGRFLIMFFASALIGAAFGLVSAMVNVFLSHISD